MRIEKRHRKRLSSVVRHDLNQFARINVVTHVIRRDLDQTEARQAAGGYTTK